MVEKLSIITSVNEKLGTEVQGKNVEAPSQNEEKENSKMNSLFEGSDGKLNKGANRKQFRKTAGLIVGGAAVTAGVALLSSKYRMLRGTKNRTADIFQESNKIWEEIADITLHGELVKTGKSKIPDCKYYLGFKGGPLVMDVIRDGRGTYTTNYYRLTDGTLSTALVQDSKTSKVLKATLFKPDGITVEKAETWRDWIS